MDQLSERENKAERAVASYKIENSLLSDAYFQLKETTKKLKDSEQKFATAFNASPDLMAITRVSDGEILEINEGYTRMLGYTRTDSVGKTTAELSIWAMPADREKFVATLKKDGQVLNFETQLRRKDGSIVTVIDAAKLFTLKNEACILSTAHDITLRKRFETEKEQYLRFFELSTDIMVIADPNGNFKKVNPTCLRVLGYSTEELIAKPFIDFVHPDDKQSTLDEMARQIKSGSSLDFENRYVCKDGTVLWLSWRANYEKSEGITYATARDITERKRSEMELLQKNRILRMLSTVNQALIHSNDETALLKEVCRVIGEMGGYRMLWIGYKEENEAKSVRPVAFAGFESGYLDSIHITWADTELGQSPIGRVLRTGQAQIVPNIATEPHMAPWHKLALERGYQSIAAFPLRNENKIFGALSIYSDKKEAFSPDEVKILEELANDLAFGISSLHVRSEREILEKELLQASADRYKALFLSSRDAIMTLEPPEWKFTSGNPATVQMFGVKNEADFLLHDPWALSPERQPDGSNSMTKAKEMIDKAMHEGSNLFEWMHRRVNGEDFPAEVLLSKVEQNGKTYLHALVRDITERKKLEEKVKEYAEEKFKVIFDNALDGILLADVTTKKFITGNRIMCEMLGYTEDEIQSIGLPDIHPKDALPFVLDQFEKQARKEIRLAKDIPVKRKDGSVFYADVNSSPLVLNGRKYLLGMFRDATERREAEQKEREYVEGVEGMNKLMVGRELKMIELKAEIEKLKQEASSS